MNDAHEKELAIIKDELADLTKRLRNLAGEASESVAQAAKDLAEKLPDTAHEYTTKVGKAIQEGAEKAKEAGKKTIDKADSYAKEKPWHVAAAAATAGAVIAGLVARKRRK